MDYTIKENDLQMENDEKQIAQLKKYTSIWICDVDFWKDEVDNCQLLLEDHLPQINELAERKKLEQFQNQIIYYRDELLPELKHDLVHHKKDFDATVNLKSLFSLHKKFETRIAAIQKQMKERRRQIDLFINNI